MAMPLGHGSEAQRLRPLARRERLLAVGVGGALAVALAIVLILSLTHSDRRSGHGCIEISLAYSMGGTQDYRCGAAARATCSGVSRPGLTAQGRQEVSSACRRAGLPVG